MSNGRLDAPKVKVKPLYCAAIVGHVHESGLVRRQAISGTKSRPNRRVQQRAMIASMMRYDDLWGGRDGEYHLALTFRAELASRASIASTVPRRWTKNDSKI